MENGVAGRKNSFTVAVDMDIHGYLCVVEDLGQPRKYDISGIRIINDFTICGCVEDADILLLLRMFYAFLFFSLPIPLSRRIYPRFSSLEMSAII